MSDDIPQWARDRALELMRAESSSAMWAIECYADRAFARYIAAHEEPPVDPLEGLIESEAESIIERQGVSFFNSKEAVRQALKRGMELARESNP